VGTTVEGHANADNLTIADSGSCGITIRSASNNFGRIYFSDDTSGGDEYRGIVQYDHTNNRLQFAANSLTAMTIDSSQRVGIGTTSPGTKLQVDGSWVDGYGTLNITGPNNGLMGVGFRNSSTYLGGVFFRDGTAGDFLELNAQGSRAIRALTNGNERARIDSSGRLLVGTTTNIGAGADNRDTLNLVAASGGGLLLGRNDTVVAAGNNIGKIEFWGNDDNGTYELCASIVAEADASHATGDKPTLLSFRTTADGASSPTERMRITSTGDLRFNSGYGSVQTAYGCRAWARVNGPASASLVQDGGFTSFTDNGVGDFSFGFDSTFPDDDYAVVCTGSRNNGNSLDALSWTAVHNLTTTGFDMTVTQTNSAFSAAASLSDLATRIGVAVFR
jgi:hypothetical protein